MSTSGDRPQSTMPPTGTPATSRGAIMAVLGGVFLLRVIGQMLVTYGGVEWLPGIENWQSGLLPYPALLAAQGVILILLALATADIWRGRGFFVIRRPRLGRLLRWLSVLYFAAMVARYAASMLLHPEWRWFGHTIPIVFHCVLAIDLFLYSRVLTRKSQAVLRRHGPAGGSSLPTLP